MFRISLIVLIFIAFISASITCNEEINVSKINVHFKERVSISNTNKSIHLTDTVWFEIDVPDRPVDTVSHAEMELLNPSFAFEGTIQFYNQVSGGKLMPSNVQIICAHGQLNSVLYQTPDLEKPSKIMLDAQYGCDSPDHLLRIGVVSFIPALLSFRLDRNYVYDHVERSSCDELEGDYIMGTVHYSFNLGAAHETLIERIAANKDEYENLLADAQRGTLYVWEVR